MKFLGIFSRLTPLLLSRVEYRFDFEDRAIFFTRLRLDFIIDKGPSSQFVLAFFFCQFKLVDEPFDSEQINQDTHLIKRMRSRLSILVRLLCLEAGCSGTITSQLIITIGHSV